MTVSKEYELTMSSYCKQNKTTIKDFVKTHTFPVIVKICLNKVDENVADQNENENEKVLLQRIVRVKYASVRFLKFHDKDVQLNSKDRTCIETCEEFTGKQFLIPVKCKGRVKFVHRPGSRRRYISVSQVLEDPPRYITLWDETPALQCKAEGGYVTVPAKSHLEVIRKVISSQTKSIYLECSNGENVFAFGENDRLNCTAVDDTKTYNLYELVRTKLLPRVIQFDSVDTVDISHVDENVSKAALSVIERPLELQGFVDRELIVGLVRNEERQRYETVLIPQILWSILTLETEKETSEEKQNYISHFHGSSDDVDLVEKSLYFMSVNQTKVVRLEGSDFRDKDFHNSNVEYVEVKEDQCPGPVVLLPQVKKKQSLFKKVHAELLRWFTTNDKKPKEKSMQQRRHAQRKDRTMSTKNTKHPTKRIRSISLNDVRGQNKTMVYRRKMYGDISYIEFFHNDPSDTQRYTQNFNSRLSRSLNDIICTENPQSMTTKDKKHPERKLSLESINNDTYAEISFNPESYGQTGDSHDTFSSGNVSANMEGACKQIGALEEREQSLQITTQTNTMQYVSVQKNKPKSTASDNIDSSAFYRYSSVETVRCLINCGLHDFAEQCKNHKLDGPFFRNLDLDVLKDPPFNLSNFHLLKLKKIIFDGWRPS